MTQVLAFAFGAALSASEAGHPSAAKTNQVHERGRGTLRAAKPTAEYIHKKARTGTEDEADGRLQDPFHGEDKHLDKNPAIIQVYRESKSRGLPQGANF